MSGADDAQTPVLEVRNVSKRFGGVKAVNDVSLRVMPREIVSLIGPNGAGKTTTFNLISGVLPPSEGQIIYRGQDTAKLRSSDFARMGIGLASPTVETSNSATAPGCTREWLSVS